MITPWGMKLRFCQGNYLKLFSEVFSYLEVQRRRVAVFAELSVSSFMQPELKSAEVEGKADMEELLICLCNSFPSII